MKDSRTRELARDYYVKHGFSVDTIIKLLPKKVSRKTLYNWLNEENWNELRRRHLNKSIEIEEKIFGILEKVSDLAQVEPTPKNMLSLARAFGLYKSLDIVRKAIDKDDPEDDKPKGLSDKTVKLIEERLGVKLEEDEDDS